MSEILKANEFERGIDRVTIDRQNNIIFDNLANVHFKYNNTDDLFNTAKGRKVFRDIIATFLSAQKTRLNILDGYSKGNNYNILNGVRRLDKEKADYRVRHNWGGYISSFATSYVLGNPVSVGIIEEADDKQLEVVQDIEWNNDINALNLELAFDTSVFGRAFEYHFRDKNNIDRVVLINPLEMFVIRDNTVEQNIIAAVHLPIYDNSINMTVYTNKEIIVYKPFVSHAVRLVVDNVTKHAYNDVPVVEWWNNRNRQGDFESELALIDAYDSSQSDTANYMSDLNDAMLLIKGDLDALGLDVETSNKMKEANMLLLQTGLSATGQQTNADANYIYKQYDVNGTEAYKNRIANDIHRFSKIPNLDDDRFNTTSSGIALLYKMIGLEQVRTDKQTYYTKALRRRYELIGNVHKELNKELVEADKLTFTFHPNIPQDIWTEIKTYIDSGGIISQETLLNNATFTDYSTEQSRILKENGATDFELGIVAGGNDEPEQEA